MMRNLFGKTPSERRTNVLLTIVLLFAIAGAIRILIVGAPTIAGQ